MFACPFTTRRVLFQHAVCAASCLIKIGHVRVYTVYIQNNLVRVYRIEPQTQLIQLEKKVKFCYNYFHLILVRILSFYVITRHFVPRWR